MLLEGSFLGKRLDNSVLFEETFCVLKCMTCKQ